MREFIKIVEGLTQPHMIEVSEESYSIDGYVTDTGAEQVDNWLNYRHHIDDSQLVEMLQTNFTKIAFLNNINVEEDARGQGFGNEMMESFLDEASDYGAEAVLLIADTAEDQAEGFDLVHWYEITAQYMNAA
jgi:ribosomal protein S18 acetylase RimI-like enzyme